MSILRLELNRSADLVRKVAENIETLRLMLSLSFEPDLVIMFV